MTILQRKTPKGGFMITTGNRAYNMLAALLLLLISSSAYAGPTPGLNPELENAVNGLGNSLERVREARVISPSVFNAEKAALRAYLNLLIQEVDAQGFAPAELEDLPSMGDPQDKRFEYRADGNKQVVYRLGERVKDAYVYGIWMRAGRGRDNHPPREVRGMPINVNRVTIFFRGETVGYDFDAATGQYPVMGEFQFIPFADGIPKQIDRIVVRAQPSNQLKRAAKIFMQFAIER